MMRYYDVYIDIMDASGNMRAERFMVRGSCAKDVLDTIARVVGGRMFGGVTVKLLPTLVMP
jgi:hypothetical protein